jgi:hypothetical protein
MQAERVRDLPDARCAAHRVYARLALQRSSIDTVEPALAADGR